MNPKNETHHLDGLVPGAGRSLRLGSPG
jgi:hypothetical protein